MNHLHSDWWYFERTRILTTARILLNFKVIGQRSRSHGFLVFFCVWYCGYPRTVLSLDQGLIILLVFVLERLCSYYRRVSESVGFGLSRSDDDDSVGCTGGPGPGPGGSEFSAWHVPERRLRQLSACRPHTAALSAHHQGTSMTFSSPGASIHMGQGGHAPLPNIWTRGDIITNVPPNISRVISATFYPCNILLISWKSF